MLSNYPALKRQEVAEALIKSVIPALAESIDSAAQDMAGDLFGDEMSTFDVERLSNDLLHALADLLVLAPVPGRGVNDMLRIHQLQNVAYAADYYGVKLHDLDDDVAILDDLNHPTPAQVMQAVFGDPPVFRPAQVAGAYVPACVNSDEAPAPVVVVDKRPKPNRMLQQIKAEVDGIRRAKVTPIHYLLVDPHADEQRIQEDRSKRAQQRRIDQNISDTLQCLDKRNLPHADGMEICDYIHCQKLFKPVKKDHKYCTDQCRSATCRKRKMDAKRGNKERRLMQQFRGSLH